MQLKSISLHGFKSFVNRTVIPLGEGITGIVGPNGCGKSNISDAIRWVLGEGNVRNIRGESLLDVVFKGAGSTKPAGFAEVSLMIDNEDQTLPLEHPEVAISRRVYRTGESDFLINNLPCRLKDIRNLFLGTGLGSQGYSVIERSMVDAVLSDRDDQRRIFFEEAAGISRYKLQRKEALRKLEATEQDLVRIDDLIREIEREVRSLARQVGKARKYRRLQDQVRDLEVDLALRQWTELERKRLVCADARDESSGDRERMAGELTRMEAEQETLKLRLLEREKSLEESREARERLLSELTAAREEVSELTTQIRGWEGRVEELSRRISEETEREQSLRRQIEERSPLVEELNRNLTEQRGRVEEGEHDFGRTEEALRRARSSEAEAAQLKMRHLVERTEESKELEALLGRIDQHTARCRQLGSHQEGIQTRAGELGQRLGQQQEEITRTDQRLDEIGQAFEETRSSLRNAETAREAFREHREDLVRRRTSLESRLNLLREQKARHEGFDVGVRFLLERKGVVKGLHGVVGELVSPVSSLSSETAEALLTDVLQWVVVEDEEAAFAALELLKAEGHGGVTFFPLRENSGREDRAKIPWDGDPPITASEDLTPLVRFLLSRVRPTDSRTEALDRSRTGIPFLRYLSPEGEVFSAEGWIRIPGGQGKGYEILERIQEIPRLEESVARTLEEETKVSKELEDCGEEIARLLESSESLDSERGGLTTRHRNLERESSESRVERGLLLEEIERVVGEIAEHEQQLSVHRQQRESLEERLGVRGETEREAEEKHRLACVSAEQAESERNASLEAVSGLRTEAIRLENAIREIETATERDREEADRLALALEQWDQEREETGRSREEAISRRQDLGAKVEQIVEHLVEAERSVDRRREERDEQQTSLAVHEQELREIRGELSGLQDRLHNDEVRELEIRSEMERIRERLLQEFKVDLAEEAERRREAEEPAPAATKDGVSTETEEDRPSEEDQRHQIDELRQKLLKIGLVNFLAAEEYDRQKERLIFHRQQREDLGKARQDLLDAIARINETAGRLFEETFEQARHHFRGVFETLFPGGEADLVFIGEDPLEGKIEIKARPRGKKLEAIRLLSTGERSLTAIALLFGVYLVKPSPFCILDELDAPLDDANIRRFIDLLRHFSERTQFVVITHNKRTMEAADRLYGVTMPEAGISKIVSVRLSDADIELTPAAAELIHSSQEDAPDA